MNHSDYQEESMLKIFQNAMNLLCHDIISPLNSIMLYMNSEPLAQKSKTMINDNINKILSSINITRYCYCLENHQYKINITQILKDWNDLFPELVINFDKKISEIEDFITQIIFHILLFIHESVDLKSYKNRVFIKNETNNKILISFESKLEDSILSEMQKLISNNLEESDINPMNASLYFFQYLLNKNQFKINLVENMIEIEY